MFTVQAAAVRSAASLVEAAAQAAATHVTAALAVRRVEQATRARLRAARLAEAVLVANLKGKTSRANINFVLSRDYKKFKIMLLQPSLKEKEVILDALDVSACLGQWRPNTRSFEVSNSAGNKLPEPRLVYERRSEENAEVEITAVAILKNEADIVCRMFQSMIPWVQACIILDTGSSDKTVDEIKRFMECHDWSGKIYSCPMNQHTFEFDTARNMLLGLARCYGKWLLLTDADYVWDYQGRFYSDLDEVDAWLIGTNENEHYRPHLVRSSIQFKYVRKTHEYIDWHQARVRTRDTQQLILNDIGDGGCKIDKYWRDILLLKKDPEDARFWFYYGTTLQSIGGDCIPLAMDALTKRIHYGGAHWPQEVYLSRQRRCQIMAQNLKYPTPVWLQEGLEAFLYCPIRLEALHYVIGRLMETNNWLLASSLGSLAYFNGRPRGSKVLFVSKGIHECSFWTQLSKCMLKTESEEYMQAGFLALRQRMVTGAVDRTDVLHEYLVALKGSPEKHRTLSQAILDGSIDSMQPPNVCRFQDAKPIMAGADHPNPEPFIQAKLQAVRDCKFKRKEGDEEKSESLDWLGHLIDAVKLSMGWAQIPRTLQFVKETLRMSPYENLIGLLFRVAFPS